jgi:hypothetical protein
MMTLILDADIWLFISISIDTNSTWKASRVKDSEENFNALLLFIELEGGATY